MPNEIKTKKTSAAWQSTTSARRAKANTPKAINVHISFDEAMRLHLGLSEVLSQLNKYNRATTAGRRFRPLSSASTPPSTALP